MDRILQYKMNISAPNLMNVCVDHMSEGRISGRLYHCYKEEPSLFSDVVELIREAENLFDTIGFPQASTKTRSFAEKNKKTDRETDGYRACLDHVGGQRPEKKATQKEVIHNTGKKGTFITNVRFRQSSTWQGEVYRVETGEVRRFSNTLDFIKVLDEWSAEENSSFVTR